MQKKTGLLLLVLTLLPFLMGTLYFQYVRSNGGQNTTNYGEIVSPMKQIRDLPTIGYWTFVILAKQCDQSCQQRLLWAETTRVLTNENMKRVRTVFISPNPLHESHKPQNLNSKIITPYPPSVTLKRWQQFITDFRLSEKMLLESILLVDPLGRFMMHYPKDRQDPKFMLKDLKRLLKYSRIG